MKMMSKPAKSHFIDLAITPGEVGREDCQEGWHLFAASLNLGSVLDVGAGLCRSKSRIPNCLTQDPCEGTPADYHCPIENIASNAFDSVTAFDVIEHVVNDVDFLRHLVRIARRHVLVTTPNYDVSKAANGCHCREYSPLELQQLIYDLDDMGKSEPMVWETFYAGDSKGFNVVKLEPPSKFYYHTEPHHAFLLDLPSI